MREPGKKERMCREMRDGAAVSKDPDQGVKGGGNGVRDSTAA